MFSQDVVWFHSEFAFLKRMVGFDWFLVQKSTWQQSRLSFWFRSVFEEKTGFCCQTRTCLSLWFVWIVVWWCKNVGPTIPSSGNSETSPIKRSISWGEAYNVLMAWPDPFLPPVVVTNQRSKTTLFSNLIQGRDSIIPSPLNVYWRGSIPKEDPSGLNMWLETCFVNNWSRTDQNQRSCLQTIHLKVH